MPVFLVALAVLAAAPASVTTSPATVADQQETMFAQVWVNDVDTGLIVEFLRRGDNLTASGDDLREVGLDALAGPAPVSLSSISGLTYRIDQTTQSVRIHVSAAAMRRVEIEPTIAQFEDLLPAWGGLLNYTLYGDNTGAGGATGEMRLFGPVGTFSSGVLVRRSPEQVGMTVRRLDTRYVFEDLQKLRRLTVGDFIGPDGSASGAIRAGGIQLATDFTLQPDLVTAPMPRISAGNGVPSTVDLYINGVRRLTQDVGAGRFTVSGVPMVDGAGQISLLVRDVLGRESVQKISFYGSRELLRPGLTASSVQAGLLRSNAYARHDRYGAAFASGTFRRGLGDWMTGEVRFALAGPVQVAGAGTTTKFGEFGIASISGDLSHSDHGEGAQASMSFRRDARRVSVFIAAQKTFGHFETLTGRDATLDGWRFQGGGSWQSRALGGFSLSATALHADRVTTRILSTTWSRPVGRRLAAFVNVVKTRARRSAFLASAGLTIVLSPRSTASVQAGHDPQGATGSASWSRYGEVDRGIDLRAGISTAPGRSLLLGGATLRGNSGQIGADVQVGEQGTAARAFASGAAVWLGGKPALTAAVGQSFAMVQTGLPDVAVTLENRPAGRTRSDGSLFLPSLPANAGARITLDYDGIDLDHEAVQAEMIVRTRAGGAVVRMPVHAVHAATIHIVLADGMPVPLGSVVRRPNGREDVVGYDGVAYLTDVANEISAEVQYGDQRCLIDFSRAAHDPIVCHAL